MPFKFNFCHVLTRAARYATVMYDPLADVHVLPRAASTLHTAVIRATASAKNLPTLAAHANVTATAAPLPHETAFGHAWSYIAAIIAPLTMIYIPTAAAAYATSERVGPHRLSLSLSGLSSSSYWAATFGVDLVMALGCAFAVAIAGAWFVGDVAPWDPAAAPASLAVLISAVPSLLASAYAASFRFAEPAAAVTTVNIAMNVAGLFPLFILLAMPEGDPFTLHYHMLVSALSPSYALFSGAHLVCWQSLSDDNGSRPPRPGDYFTKGNLIRGGVEGAVVGGVLWSLALWYQESRYRRRLRDGSAEGAALAAAASATGRDGFSAVGMVVQAELFRLTPHDFIFLKGKASAFKMDKMVSNSKMVFKLAFQILSISLWPLLRGGGWKRRRRGTRQG